MTSARIGYSRVSTLDQNASAQADALAAAGCDRVFVDHFTGTRASRPEWDRCRDILRAGDTLVITRLDRLGRSAKDLLDIAQWLRDNNITLQATEQAIDTSTAEGRLFYAMISAFAEFEREMIVARTRDGLAAARARGRSGGRPSALTTKQQAEVRRMLADDERTVSEVAELFGVSRATVYRLARRAERER